MSNCPNNMQYSRQRTGYPQRPSCRRGMMNPRTSEPDLYNITNPRTSEPDRHNIMSPGTSELAHLEIICAIVHQLTRNLSPEELTEAGFDKYYVDHTLGIWPQSAGGVPWSATTFPSKGDPITDLHEDMAAEQKARTTYDNILRLVKDPEVCDPIRFLRKREIIHYQRFGESLRIVQENLDIKNFYAINPAFDMQQDCGCKKGK